MIESTQTLAPSGDVGVAKPVGDTGAATPGAAAGRPSTRVYVDQDGSGVFVYRLVDAATGRVLVELPRERAGELKDAPGYAAGALASTSA